MTACPLCGHPVKGLLVDPIGRSVAAHGVMVRLTETEMRLFQLLHERMPRAVPVWNLRQNLHPVDEVSETAIRLVVCCIRKKIADVPGLWIRNGPWGQASYALEFKPKCGAGEVLEGAIRRSET